MVISIQQIALLFCSASPCPDVFLQKRSQTNQIVIKSKKLYVFEPLNRLYPGCAADLISQPQGTTLCPIKHLHRCQRTLLGEVEKTPDGTLFKHGLVQSADL